MLLFNNVHEAGYRKKLNTVTGGYPCTKRVHNLNTVDAEETRAKTLVKRDSYSAKYKGTVMWKKCWSLFLNVLNNRT